MEAFSRPRIVAALTVGIAFTWSTGHAQDISVANFDRIDIAKSFYEYNTDGVPILGLITMRMANDRVKFTTCTNATMEVSVKQLKTSAAKCPGKIKDPGMWWASNTLMPLIKTGPGPANAMVKFNGKTIDLSGLPDDYRESYKASLSNAKSGDWIGYAFTGDDGKKSLWLFTTPAQ